MAALGLHYCVWSFSSCDKHRLLTSYLAWTSHCPSYCALWGAQASVAVACELTSCRMRA